MPSGNPERMSDITLRRRIKKREEINIPTANTALLRRIIECPGDRLAAPQDALVGIEQEFEGELLIGAGSVNDVTKHALKYVWPSPSKNAALYSNTSV